MYKYYLWHVHLCLGTIIWLIKQGRAVFDSLKCFDFENFVLYPEVHSLYWMSYWGVSEHYNTSVFASFRCLVPKAVGLFPLLTFKYVPRNRIVWLVCMSVFETCCSEAEKFLFLPWLSDSYPKNWSVRRVDSIEEDEKPWGKCWSVSAGNKQQPMGPESPLRNCTACLLLALGLKSGIQAFLPEPILW